MSSLRNTFGFIKLEHSLFSLPLLFAGAVLAENKWPSLRTSGLILLAGVSARTVAMILNRIIDRRIDAKNPRTQARHLPSGTLKLHEAWFGVFLGLCVYLLSAWLLSDWCLKLSWIPLLAFTVYPYFKRFTKWTHVGLGLVWALAPMGGFFAVRPSLDQFWPVVLLGLFCVFWLAGFDIIYATLDENFDRAHGVKSLPSAWGSEKALGTASFFHFCAFICLLCLYAMRLSGTLTVMILGAIAILLYAEQKLSRNVEVAFFRVNVLVGFFVLLLVISGVRGV